MDITNRAIDRIKLVLHENNMDVETVGLRIFAFGGGCSGISYNISFENLDSIDRLSDSVTYVNGLSLIMENRIQPLLTGVNIDYVTKDGQSGFSFQRESLMDASCGGCTSKGCES